MGNSIRGFIYKEPPGIQLIPLPITDHPDKGDYSADSADQQAADNLESTAPYSVYSEIQEVEHK